jgi:S-DNA-T family DNA segregation ATPase FtsK/SpoIIIE
VVRSNLKREIAAIALLLFAIFLAGAMLFQRVPAGVPCSSAGGLFGPAGACLRSALLYLVGIPAASLLPLVPAIHALRLFGRMEVRADRRWLGLLVGVIAILPIAIALALGAAREVHPLSGLWGNFVAYYMAGAFGAAGAWIVLVLAASALTAVSLWWNPVRMLVGHSPGSVRGAIAGSGPAATLNEPPPEEMPAIDAGLAPDGAAAKPERAKRERKPRGEAGGVRAGDDSDEPVIPGPLTGVGRAADELPPTTLLTAPPAKNVEVSKRELDAIGQKLMDALKTFRVDGQLVGRTTGPVVTQYEIEPSPGVKVRQFANLANDLALAMRAASIRIVAPIPGRGAVGVEVPNPQSEIVNFRELIEDEDFKKGARALPIALGKDLEGRPVIADLAKMPHLLIAGATGSGKSVCINTIITSLVYRHTPQTLRFLMIDPKMVELSAYNALPHMRHKVVTDNMDAAKVLKWAVLEMEERYQIMAANGARNIQDLNRKVLAGEPLRTPPRPDVAFEDTTYKGGLLPYIVVIIDELADLMMTVQGEVELPLAKLAQKARAIGIHLILATQRPSVNVVTGLIKANFPSRIAFRVASQVDSRTILDGIGAESLLGNGDMLFIPPAKSEPARLQGAFLPNDDTENLMKWFRDRPRAKRPAAAAEAAPSEFDILDAVRKHDAEERRLAEQGDAGDEGDIGDRDALFREAAEVCIQHQGGSTSLLQRRLKVGYGRAARIIDQLHDAGILGPPDGSKPRDVMVGLSELDRICGPRT